MPLSIPIFLFCKRWFSIRACSISKQVYQKVESFKRYLSTVESEQAISKNMVLLGKSIFNLREQDISIINKNPSILLLAQKIRQDTKAVLEIKKQNNIFLSNRYIYLHRLFLRIFDVS